MTFLRKNIFPAFAFVICLSLIGCAIQPLPAEIKSAAPTSTEVLHYVPRDVPRNEKAGACWTNSIAAPRDNAWRCMAGNEIFDPCFAFGPAVVCGVNPAMANEGFRLVLDKPMPSTPAAASGETNTGWLIQLADGTICNRATGARGMVDGQMTTYYCTSKNPDDSVAVLGELTAGMVWTADVAVIDRATGKTRERKVLPVVRVWQ